MISGFRPDMLISLQPKKRFLLFGQMSLPKNGKAVLGDPSGKVSVIGYQFNTYSSFIGIMTLEVRRKKSCIQRECKFAAVADNGRK